MATWEIDEIYIDLSYGRIRGKWWGSKQKRPILLLHGWQDNAGSFDTLIPLLPPEFDYLAIDWPGHGFSSHLPKGVFYHWTDLVPLLEEIRIKFKWPRLSIIAHSMGVFVSFFYASIFPDKVDLVCALDILKIQQSPPKATESIPSRAKKLIELVSNLKDKSPEYTYDELVERVYEGSGRSLNKDKAKYLIERGTRPSTSNPRKFYFTRDIRIKGLQSFFLEPDITTEFIKRIQAAYLFIKGDENHRFTEPEEYVQEGVETFRKYNKRFEMMCVRGKHHFHLNEPELLAGKIGEFLNKYYVKDEQIQDAFKLISKL